ncbi:MAG: DUF456 family protein [Negativicutes bacterium]|nr:DUF456 family protein [Negativicutes bacterium]
MFIIKILAALIMMAGLFGTLVPRIPGTVLIFCGALFYGAVSGFYAVAPWIWTLLLVLLAVAELGGRWLRVVLTRRFSMTRLFATNSTIANLGGILAADALLGPALGLIAWELIAGKALEPRGNTVAKILLRLAAVAILRFGCGVAMVVVVIKYMFI